MSEGLTSAAYSKTKKRTPMTLIMLRVYANVPHSAAVIARPSQKIIFFPGNSCQLRIASPTCEYWVRIQISSGSSSISEFL